MFRKGQGSLEYLILIAGIVVIAAAIFFLTRGFYITEKEAAAPTLDLTSCLSTLGKVELTKAPIILKDFEGCIAHVTLLVQNNSAPFTDWYFEFDTLDYIIMCPEGENGTIKVETVDGLKVFFNQFYTCEYGTVIGFAQLLRNKDINFTSEVNLTIASIP
jgi:hypothetical protein